MPLELLREIASKPLPLVVENAADIDKLRVLRAAGHVQVVLPEPSSASQIAQVLEITPEGWVALKE